MATTGGFSLSASVSVDDFGGDEPQLGGTLAVSPDDQISVVDAELAIDEITIIDDDIEVIEDSRGTTSTSEHGQDALAPQLVTDEVRDGFQDPIMPFVILGMLTLIAILVVAATLAL